MTIKLKVLHSQCPTSCCPPLPTPLTWGSRRDHPHAPGYPEEEALQMVGPRYGLGGVIGVGGRVPPEPKVGHQLRIYSRKEAMADCHALPHYSSSVP